MQIDLTGLAINKLGENYVNVNSRDKREGEKQREKQLFKQGDIREKKRQTKRCGKKIDSKKL